MVGDSVTWSMAQSLWSLLGSCLSRGGHACPAASTGLSVLPRVPTYQTAKRVDVQCPHANVSFEISSAREPSSTAATGGLGWTSAHAPAPGQRAAGLRRGGRSSSPHARQRHRDRVRGGHARARRAAGRPAVRLACRRAEARRAPAERHRRRSWPRVRPAPARPLRGLRRAPVRAGPFSMLGPARTRSSSARPGARSPCSTLARTTPAPRTAGPTASPQTSSGSARSRTPSISPRSRPRPPPSPSTSS